MCLVFCVDACLRPTSEDVLNYPLDIFLVGKLPVMSIELIYGGGGICGHLFCIKFSLRR